MTEADAYDILSDTILAVLIGSAPILGVALVVGLVIAFFQALTQIQEMTLVFVPKMAAVFVGLALFASFMLDTLARFTRTIFDLATHAALL